MLLWKPVQYRDVWDSIYLSCDKDTQISLDFRLDQLVEKGALAREPISKPLGDGIFELRAKDVRVLYYFGFDRTIVFVNGIIKKRGDVLRREIKLAIKRKKFLEEESEGTHEISQTN